MFTVETLEFLNDLSRSNTRDWFADNRARYETFVKQPATEYADRMAAELTRETGIPHRGKVFRIHRDIRFSKDKTPYNAHVHISLIPQGNDTSPPARMMGLAPGYFTLGCGAFAFDAPGLAAFRQRVAGPDGDRVAQVLSMLAQSGVRLSEPELKRVPAPYDTSHPHGDLLRRKGMVGWVDAANAEAGLGPGIMVRSMAGFSRLRPLFDLLMQG